MAETVGAIKDVILISMGVASLVVRLEVEACDIILIMGVQTIVLRNEGLGLENQSRLSLFTLIFL